ncbi:hypothetical protein [Marinoscillum sp.]|uniref:hypothetical protein n=1 Tax=Marinoscillum sp. TaxID=2024838 RepID=UPI003BAB8413
MDELDELKDIWKSNGRQVSDQTSNRLHQMDQSISTYQRKVRRTNIMASVYMSLTAIFLVSLLFIYSEESWLFYASIIGVVVLAVGVIFLLWSRSLDTSKKLTLSARDYTAYRLKKLRRSKKIIEYSPLYGLVLGLLVNAYAYSLLHHASGEFVFWVTNANWVYIIIVSFVSYKVKMRRYMRDVQPIVDELEAYER